MTLHDLIKIIEEDKEIGIFSKDSKTIEKGLSTHEITFADKPSQQVLKALGGNESYSPTELLTAQGTIKTTGNADIKVKSFTKKVLSEITLTGARLDQLFSSVKIYVNTALFPENAYSLIMGNRDAIQKDSSWDIHALGICHAQEVDILVGTTTSAHGRAHVTPLPDGTIIKADAPALLLLSSSRLNLKGDHAKILKTNQEKLKYIRGMYDNLFNAAVSEKRQYIVMPAAGLGEHGGDPRMYFAALLAAAEQYPELNIIYNASVHDKEFDSLWKIAGNPANVGSTTKNIIFVAAKLLKEGYSCAMHNPSSSNVVYGLSDVGEHWQSASATVIDTVLDALKHIKEPGRTFQATVGTITTSVLGSRGVNPHGFETVIERNLCEAREHSAESVILHSASTGRVPPSPIVSTNPIPPAVVPAETKKAPDIVVSPKSQAKSPSAFFQPAPVLEPEPSNTKPSSFNPEQLAAIDKLIKSLTRQYSSWWPYPHKERKKEKKEALLELKTNAETMSIPEAIAAIKAKYKSVTKGNVSTRTADLLNELEGKHKAPKALSCYY